MTAPFAHVRTGTLVAAAEGVADLVLDGAPVRATFTPAQADRVRSLVGTVVRCVYAGSGEGLPRIVRIDDAATWRPPTPEERTAAIHARWGELLRRLGSL